MKPSNQSPNLKDDDIQALLDARVPTSSPADLDARILAAAKAEVQQADSVQRRSISRYGSWLAVAAVCVLAIILVPVMQQSSDNSDAAFSPGLSFNDSVLPTTEIGNIGATVDAEVSLTNSGAVLQSDSLVLTAPATTKKLATTQNSEKVDIQHLERAAKKESASLLSEELQSNERLRAKKMELLESRRNSAASTEPAPDTNDINAMVDAMTDEEIRQTFESHPYRQDRTSWQAEIKRLEGLEEAAQVVRERRLFERMYPGAQ